MLADNSKDKECPVQLKDLYEHFKGLADCKPQSDELDEDNSGSCIFDTGALNADLTEEEIEKRYSKTQEW